MAKKSGGKRKYRITVRTVGNPDFGQYSPISPQQTLTADTIQELRKKVRDYQLEWDVGGGNWKNPPVYYGSRRIGYMSFNGRVWKGRGWPTEEVTTFPEQKTIKMNIPKRKSQRKGTAVRKKSQTKPRKNPLHADDKAAIRKVVGELPKSASKARVRRKISDVLRKGAKRAGTSVGQTAAQAARDYAEEYQSKRRKPAKQKTRKNAGKGKSRAKSRRNRKASPKKRNRSGSRKRR